MHAIHTYFKIFNKDDTILMPKDINVYKYMGEKKF